MARLKRVKGPGDQSRLLSFRSLLSRRKRSINNQTSIVIFPKKRLLKYLTKLFYLKFKKKGKREIKTWKGKFHVQVPPFLPPVPSEKGKKVEKRCANEKNRKTQQRTSNQIDDLGVVRLGHPRSVNLFNRKVHTRQWEKIIIIFRSRNKNKTRKKCLSFSNKRNQAESNWIPW